MKEVRRRETELGIPSFDADRRLYAFSASGYPGYPDPVPYLCPPQTRYQQRVRGEAGDKVTHQYTRRFNEKIIERYEFLFLSLVQVVLSVISPVHGMYHCEAMPIIQVDGLYYCLETSLTCTDIIDLPLPLQPRRVDGQLVPKDQCVWFPLHDVCLGLDVFFAIVLYGRISGDGYFQTAMTTVGPSAKCSRLLHPTVGQLMLTPTSPD